MGKGYHARGPASIAAGVGEPTNDLTPSPPALFHAKSFRSG